MYIYAIINDDNIVEDFSITESPVTGEEEVPYYILVDAVDESWIKRKRWNATTQTWENVLPTEVSYRTVQHSGMYTHYDADGTKHWLDTYVNDLASDVSALQTQIGDDSVSEQISDAIAGLSFSVDANGVLSVG